MLSGTASKTEHFGIHMSGFTSLYLPTNSLYLFQLISQAYHYLNVRAFCWSSLSLPTHHTDSKGQGLSHDLQFIVFVVVSHNRAQLFAH